MYEPVTIGESNFLHGFANEVMAVCQRKTLEEPYEYIAATIAIYEVLN
jgi:hypothetical protein